MFKPGSLDHLQKYYNTVYKNEGYIEKNLREIEINFVSVKDQL